MVNVMIVAIMVIDLKILTANNAKLDAKDATTNLVKNALIVRLQNN